MPSVPYKKRKIGQSYLVWFQGSNSFVQMEEPAWFVLRKTTNRNKPETIALEFSERYGINPEESLAFVSGIRRGIAKLNKPGGRPGKMVDGSVNKHDHAFIPYSVHHYKIGRKYISFSFQNHGLEHYLHPLICHLECGESDWVSHHFELFLLNEQVVFRLNGEVRGQWAESESHLVKGMVFMHLINVMHEKSDADWLMTVHASAITNGRKTILFAAPPGNGKTTMAALLQARGYRLISDDFVPIDRDSFCAHPFPIAMSVKTGSVDVLSPVFPSLEKLPENVVSPEKTVRFLAPAKDLDVAGSIFPVNDFVFIEYNPSVVFSWEKPGLLQGIKLLLDQAWVSPGDENAEAFMNAILRKSFYKLTYSDNEKALETITNLFDHD